MLVYDSRMHSFDSSDEESDREYDAEPFKIDWMNSLVGVGELPGKRFQHVKRNLSWDLDALRTAEINHVYCLCSKAELWKYRVPNLLEKYEEYGFQVHHYPFLDGGAPDIQDLMRILKDMHAVMETNKKLFLHCFGGLGRTGMIIACLAMYLDDKLMPEDAIAQVRSLRGPRAVQSVKQYNFIHEFRAMQMDLATGASQTKVRDCAQKRSD